MKTDRELLELAARAAGELTPSWYRNQSYIEGVLSRWNPLTDDCDALRLAVRLRIDIKFFDGFGDVRAYFKDSHLEEPYGSDISAATRRAIVRAAAAIGEKMP